MSAEGNLHQLLNALSPRRVPGEYVFVFVNDPEAVPSTEVLASVSEAEGVSLVLHRHDADRAGLAYDFIAGWITLEVHSALHAVGLTATVSSALAGAGISCNVIAGYHHDHLLVPFDRAGDALDVLHALRRSELHLHPPPPTAPGDRPVGPHLHSPPPVIPAPLR